MDQWTTNEMGGVCFIARVPAMKRDRGGPFEHFMKGVISGCSITIMQPDGDRRRTDD